MKYTIDKCSFVLGEKTVEFKSEIDTVLEKEGIYIVLILENDMNKTGELYGSRNIFGVNEEGEIMWQVEAPTKDPVDLYTGIGLDKDNGLVLAFSFSCWLCTLDPKTGKILDQEFTK